MPSRLLSAMPNIYTRRSTHVTRAPSLAQQTRFVLALTVLAIAAAAFFVIMFALFTS